MGLNGPGRPADERFIPYGPDGWPVLTQPAKPPPSGPSWGGLVLCVVAGAVFAGGATYALAGAVTPSAPPVSCLDALDDAESVYLIAGDAFENLSSMTEARTRNRLDQLVEESEFISLDMGLARTQYDINAATCRQEGSR